jgi:hypothetical protein
MTMDILRYGHDTFGERLINGASWDLLPVAFWAGIAVIVIHLIYRAMTRNSGRKGGG